jgi:hypothetical protein
MIMANDIIRGYVLSDAALYSFKCQDVYPDIVSFAAALPEHLRPLFLIPVVFEPGSDMRQIASRIANTEEADWFGYLTFIQEGEPSIPSNEPGSIFKRDVPLEMTHHQESEEEQDENWQVPDRDDVSIHYLSDVEDLYERDAPYPYYTKEKPLRHSFWNKRQVAFCKLSLKPDELQFKVPEKIKTKSKACSVKLISYDRGTRIFTFSVNCGRGAKQVRASLSEIDEIALSCSCPFWRWNGPEYHAKHQDYQLGEPRGTASIPRVRDPENKYWLCKHVYSVIKRLDHFIGEIVDKGWATADEELLEEIDKNWDKLAISTEIPLEQIEEEKPEFTGEEMTGENK